VVLSVLLSSRGPPLLLPSLPTRRSSDLVGKATSSPRRNLSTALASAWSSAVSTSIIGGSISVCRLDLVVVVPRVRHATLTHVRALQTTRSTLQGGWQLLAVPRSHRPSWRGDQGTP